MALTVEFYLHAVINKLVFLGYCFHSVLALLQKAQGFPAVSSRTSQTFNSVLDGTCAPYC